MYAEIRKILTLAWPLIIAQLGQMLLGVTDTVMVARLGVVELATLTFSTLLFYIPFIFGIGLLTCVSVRTSSARGAGDAKTARVVCCNGLYLAATVGTVLLFFAIALVPYLDQFGQAPEVVARMPKFFILIMASGVCGLMGVALMNHAYALNRPWPAVWITLIGSGLNIGLNWVLIFGKFGILPLGLEGAGLATLIVRSLIVIALMVWMGKATGLGDWVPARWLQRPDRHELQQQWILGAPAAIQAVAEMSAFSFAGILIGRFGTEALAAHQIALTCTTTAFLLPMGLSMALMIRMSKAFGAADAVKMRQITKAGWLLTLCFTSISAMVFQMGGHWLASSFIDRLSVIKEAVGLLAIASVFQMVDGLQVTSTGMLRGLQDVRIPTILGVMTYWVVTIPIAVVLSDFLGMKAKGVWWGLAVGLTFAALVMGWRLYRMTHRRKPNMDK